MDFPCKPINETMEIILLFATLPCMVLIFKRNLIGATVYFGIYGAYFGTGLYNAFLEIQATGVTITSSVDLFAIILGIIIPLLTFLDILLNKNRTKFGADKKTDWFYKNEKYEREFDERADRNQYKF
jgi:uncharacterized MnhB-related membrane protein